VLLWGIGPGPAAGLEKICFGAGILSGIAVLPRALQRSFYDNKFVSLNLTAKIKGILTGRKVPC